MMANQLHSETIPNKRALVVKSEFSKEKKPAPVVIAPNVNINENTNTFRQ
jgi:hypothetical protein